MTKLRFAGALTAACVILLSGTAFAAEDKPGFIDDPKAGSNRAAEIMAMQEPLVNAAERIIALDKDSEVGGTWLEVRERTLTLWWKGEPAEDIRAEIERQQSEHDIRIVLLQSAYSQRELTDLAVSLEERWESFPGMTRVGPRIDGSGLEIGAVEPERIDPKAFGVPVTIVKEEQYTQTSRTNDFAPWWGGAVVRGAFPGAGACSSGFAVARYFLWWETQRGMLTAEHCAPGGGINFNNGVGSFMGNAEPAPARRGSDSLFITARSDARIYDGGVGTGEFSKPVVGAVGNFPGQFVCTSGAATGANCNIRTDRINQVVFSGFMFVQSVALATEMSGTVATGTGDSGGPVFTLTSNFAKTRAAGIMTGGLNPVPCRRGTATTCFNRVAFVDLGWVLIAQNASLLTSP